MFGYVSAKVERKEGFAIVVLLGVIVLANVLTLAGYPRVWCDEVMDTDPAANLVREGRFISRAHTYARVEAFFPGNPLYHVLLGGWFSCVGFGIVQSRLFDLVLAVAGAIALWCATKRLDKPSRPVLRILLVALVLSAPEFVRVYRGHRYDLAGIPVIMLLVLVQTSPRFRWLLTAALAALLPLAGFGCVYFVGFLAIAWLVFDPRRAWAALGPISIGVSTGLLVYATLLRQQGVLTDLISFIAWPELRADRSRSLLQQWGKSLGYSSSALLAVAALLVVRHGSHRTAGEGGRLSRWALFTIVWSAILPFAMIISGRYQFWYGWMVCMPALFAFINDWDQVVTNSGWRSKVVAAACGVIIVTGLPLTTAKGLLEAREYDYAPLAEFVKRHVRFEDVALSDAAPYYAVKTRAARTYAQYAFPQMDAAARRSVTVVLLSGTENKPMPVQVRDWLGQSNARWREVGRYLVPRGEWRVRLGRRPREAYVYDVTILRKE